MTWAGAIVVGIAGVLGWVARSAAFAAKRDGADPYHRADGYLNGWRDAARYIKESADCGCGMCKVAQMTADVIDMRARQIEDERA